MGERWGREGLTGAAVDEDDGGAVGGCGGGGGGEGAVDLVPGLVGVGGAPVEIAGHGRCFDGHDGGRRVVMLL